MTTEPGWARARRAFRSVFGANGNVRVEIGQAKNIGGGLHRRAFAAHVDLVPDPGRASGPYVALVPQRGEAAAFIQGTRREAAILEWLQGQRIPFRVPKVAGSYPDGDDPLLVVSFVQGFPLGHRAVGQTGLGSRPWEVVGQVAADIHRLEGPRGNIEGFATRRQHAEDALSVFEGLRPLDPLVADAQAWAKEHLPPPAGARLLHGDLLGQNLLLPLDEEEPVGVIDWEFALTGDPAYDLAIVTRGLRRPFRRADGFELLLDAYREAGGAAIAATDVSFYELCLVAEWYKESLDPATRSHPPEQELMRLKGVLRRAIARG